MQPEAPKRSLREELLMLSVSAAVPLYSAALRRQGGPNDFQWEWAREFSNELGERGDILQFGGGRKGETATVFNRFAYALAILSFLPGGVDFCGMHFEATPTATQAPGGSIPQP